MHLEHLNINGFKSFAKKGELEFSAPITAIVGPNGSGKSNVAEAFRFVLGEQSPSKMRGKKGEDLIWGGSDKVSKSNRASVSVTLNNQNRTFPVDYDQVILERTVHRDGQNEYSVNGSKVRLKDVQEILAAANIGPTGHHIISQGEADRILSASQKERREMIEDALGLKVYQFKKNEAEKKLAKTEANITQVESLRREVAPHLKFLEKQVKKIEKAIELREELKRAYSEYLFREEKYLKVAESKLEEERSEPSKKLEELRSALEAAKKTLAEAEEDTERDKLLSAETILSEKRESKQTLLRQSGQLEGQLSLLKKQLETAERKASSNTKTLVPYSEVESLVATIEKDINQAIKEENISLLKRSFADVLHKLKHFLNRAGETENNDTSDIKTEYESLILKKEELDKTLEGVSREEVEAEKAYTEVQQTIEFDRSKSREAEREIFRLVGEQRDCETKLNELDNKLNVIARDKEEFKRELNEAVALLGRDASMYMSYGDDGLNEESEAESREKQGERRRELEKLKIRIEELGGGGEDIEKEYKEVKERDEFLEREIKDLTESVAKLESLIADLTEELNERFVAGIEKISTEFSRFFTLMFGGGNASLERVKPKVKKKKSLLGGLLGEDEEVESEEGEEEEEKEEGIEIAVSLPNKRVKGLDMLSGGERALTSIALIFAMSQVNPPLFVILDETDAALDEANSRRYGDMIEALAKKSQLILITHNRETMSRAGILYGVTMSGDGVSKLLSVKFDEAVKVAK